MWPDLAIFKVLGSKISSNRSPNHWQLFLAILKNLTLLKTALATFCATFGKIGLLLTPTAGHTVSDRLLTVDLGSVARSIDNIQFWGHALISFHFLWPSVNIFLVYFCCRLLPQCDQIGRFLKVTNGSPNNVILSKKLQWPLFGQLLYKFGPLFILTSGHTGSR